MLIRVSHVDVDLTLGVQSAEQYKKNKIYCAYKNYNRFEAALNDDR